MLTLYLGMVFPIYVNLYQKDRMDSHRATEVGIVSPNEKRLELERQMSAADYDGKPEVVEIREADLK
jgi:hypothetical protein